MVDRISCMTLAYEAGLLYTVKASAVLDYCQMDPVVGLVCYEGTTYDGLYAEMPIIACSLLRSNCRKARLGVGTQDCGIIWGLSPASRPPTPNWMDDPRFSGKVKRPKNFALAKNRGSFAKGLLAE